MRVGIFTSRLPSSKTSGASLHLLGVCCALAQRGHMAELILCGELIDIDHSKVDDSELRSMVGSGVRLHLLPLPPRKNRPGVLKESLQSCFTPRRFYEDMYRVDELRVHGEPCIRALKLDVLLVFDFGHMAALRDFTGCPKVAFPGDPLDQLAESRFRRNPLLNWKGRAVGWLRWKQQGGFPSWLAYLSRGYNRLVWQAAHHVEELRRTVSHVDYVPTPIPDLLRGRVPPARGPETKFRVLHLGHLGGTAAILSLGVIRYHILPALRRQYPGQFELHFIGRRDVAPKFLEGLDGPDVVFRGFVDDLDAEIAHADVFLVPMPHTVGSRTRILTALPYGVCIVADASAALGNPELRTTGAVLFGDGGTELANLTLRALADPELRRAGGLKAKQVWRERFSVESAGMDWVKALERAADKAAPEGSAASKG